MHIVYREQIRREVLSWANRVDILGERSNLSAVLVAFREAIQDSSRSKHFF